MIDDIKEMLMTNWHPMRWIALVAGLFMMIQAVRYMDGFSALLGTFMLYQAVTNNGCIVGRNCAVNSEPGKSTNAGNIENVEFTEIKEH